MHSRTTLAALLAAALSAVSAATIALAAPAEKATGAAAPPAGAPRLAVIVSVDGLSWSRLDAHRAVFTGGLKRLLDEGLVEREARYRHLNTETAPGHAALGTGAPPRVTGIVSNRWFAPKPDGSLRAVGCTDTAVAGERSGETQTVPGPGNLKVPTLADRLVERFPSSRVVAIAGKDRGAIFLAGKSPSHAVYWFDPETGRFTSSAAYDAKGQTGTLVATIVARYNKHRAGGHLPGRFGLYWKKLSAPSSTDGAAGSSAGSGLSLYQLPYLGLGWDHDLTKASDGYFGAILGSPFVDELVADLAVDVLSDQSLALGRRDTPDILCLSFSGQDLVSHNYGPESEENLDLLRRLDAQLGRVLGEIERDLPGIPVVLALSADHGFLPIPEAAKKRSPSGSGGRLVVGSYPYTNFLARLNREIDDELCLPPTARPVYGNDTWGLKYDLPALPMIRTVAGGCGAAGRAATREDVDRVLPSAVRRLFSEEVADVLLASGKDSWDPRDPAVEAAKNAFDPDRTGEAILLPRSGVLMHWDPARGSGHGGLSEDETHVPLIFWGAGIRKGVSVIPSTPYDLAPTLGKLLGVPLPDAVGRALLTGR